MKRSIAVATLSVAAILAVPSAAGAKTTTLNTTWVDTYFKLVDHAPLQAGPNQPPSPGDVVLLRSTYSVRGRAVAHERAACTVMTWPHVMCNLSIALAGGRLVVATEINPMGRGTQRLAIVGGTGAYRGARGEIALRFTSQSRGTAVFTIIT